MRGVQQGAPQTQRRVKQGLDPCKADLARDAVDVEPVDVLSCETHPTLVGDGHARELTQQRALARLRRAEQQAELPRGQRDRNPVQAVALEVTCVEEAKTHAKSLAPSCYVRRSPVEPAS